MGAILNGIALHGGPALRGDVPRVQRLHAPGRTPGCLMKLPVTYVWTHDSIGLGEDGPTRQPVEHLSALRAIPGLDVVRPADANETVAAWRTILGHTDRPAALCLTRQNVPTFDRSVESGFADAAETARGGYILVDASNGQPDVIVIATGSEVQLAVTARAARGRGRPHSRGVDAVRGVVPCAG